MRRVPTPPSDSSGRPVPLGKRIGKGGEGAVYAVADRPGLVAKVYHRRLDELRAAKIRAMAQLGDDTLRTLTAWPLDLLFDRRRFPIGILMPYVKGHHDIHALYSPKSRKKHFPDSDWRFLVRVAANASRAFGAVHAKDCVIGDVNHGSVLVDDEATVTLIDCDSFQVSTKDRFYPCEVGVPLFTPPELQGFSFKEVVRSRDHDHFGLAVLVFHLLFMGRHPFLGRYLGSGEMTPVQAIAEYRYAYGSRPCEMAPPPHSLPVRALPAELRTLLERAFSREGVGRRPNAAQWIEGLSTLEQELVRCALNSSHWFWRGAVQCPWCTIEAATGVTLFQSSVPVLQGLVRSQVEALVERIRQVPDPEPIDVSGSLVRAAYQTSPQVERQRRFTDLRMRLSALTSFGAVLWLIRQGSDSLLSWKTVLALLLLAGGLLILRPTREERRLTIQVVQEHERAQNEWRQWKKRWAADPTLARFQTRRGQILALAAEWSQLPQDRVRHIRELGKGKPIDPRLLADVDREFATRRRDLESRLQHGERELQTERAKAHHALRNLEKNLREARLRLSRARANLFRLR